MSLTSIGVGSTVASLPSQTLATQPLSQNMPVFGNRAVALMRGTPFRTTVASAKGGKNFTPVDVEAGNRVSRLSRH